MPIVLAALVLVSLLAVVYLMFSGDKAIEAKIAAPATVETTTTAPPSTETEPTTEAPRTTAPQATTEAPKTTTRPVPTPTPSITTQPRTTPKTLTPVPPRTTQAPPPPPSPVPAPAPSITDEVIAITNQERVKAGCAPVVKNSDLTQQAQQHSELQAADKAVYHLDGPVGFPTWGENVAGGQETATEVMNAWMNSQGHRGNILTCNFTMIGVGLAYNEGVPYWTQMFAA